MKKTILGFAFMAIALAGSQVSAQNPGNNVNCENQVCTPNQVCVQNQACTDGKDCCLNSKAFEGINLTDAQKTKLQTLCQNEKAKRVQKRADFKKNKAKRDSLDKERKAKAREERIAAKKAWLSQIKSILTPDQYVQFLENNMVYGPANKGANMKFNGDRKEFHKGKHHNFASNGKKFRKDLDKSGKRGKKSRKG